MRAFAQAVGGLLARMISPDLPTDPYGEIPVEDYVEEPEEPEEEEDPLMQVYSPDEAETTWIPSPTFHITLPSTMLMSLPPPYTKMPGYFVPIFVS